MVLVQAKKPGNVISAQAGIEALLIKPFVTTQEIRYAQC